MIIQVAILNKVYVSDDQGHSWRQYPRQVKAGPTIRYLGVAAESHVPFELPDVIWDFIYLSPDGHGVAVNHEKTHNATGPEAKGTFVANESVEKVLFSLILAVFCKSTFSVI
jgi:hypothetical protein